MTNATTETDAAAALGAAGVAVVDVLETPMAMLPPGYTVHNLESMLVAPIRRRGTVVYDEAQSFIKAVLIDGREGTRLYVDKADTTKPPQFSAIFNDHWGQDEAAWRDHRAVYRPKFSVEWARWTANDGKHMNQQTFSTFIEDNLPDIVTPDAAMVLEISRTFEAKKKVNFASSIRLPNGQIQFTYEEEIQGSAGKGQFSIPETFQLGIPVFVGDEAYAVTARLRYSMNDGKLALWFDLLRPHKIVEDACKHIGERISKETAREILAASSI